MLEANGATPETPGVVLAEVADKAFITQLVEALSWHRHWERPPSAPEQSKER